MIKDVEITGQPTQMPPELSLRILAERGPPNCGEVLYVLNRYLRERGDKNIRSVRDLISQSTFYDHGRIDGVTAPPKGRLEDLLTKSERLINKSDGTPFVQKRQRSRRQRLACRAPRCRCW